MQADFFEDPRWQDADAFYWRRITLMVVAAIGVLALTFVLGILLQGPLQSAFGRTAGRYMLGATFLAAGAVFIVPGWLARRRFPGEAFVAGGVILWSAASLLDTRLGVMNSLPVFVLLWASLFADLSPETRITFFFLQVVVVDGFLDVFNLESGAGNWTAALSLAFLVATSFALPIRGIWRRVPAVIGLAACVAAFLVGIRFATDWNWRVATFFAAVLGLATLCIVSLRHPTRGRVPLLLTRPSPSKT